MLDDRGISDYCQLQEALAQGRADRLTYFAFDLLYLDGYDLRDVPLIDRKQLLSKLLINMPAGGRLRFTEHIEADATQLVDRACAMQLEGIISKERESLYKSGRQETWLKIKCNKSDTFPIIAFVEKLGAKPRRIASLYLGRWEDGRLLYAGKAQTGFKHKALYELRERLDPYIRPTSPLSVPVKKPKATWVEPVVQAEIEYSSATVNNLLRAPVYKGIRDDLSERKPARKVASSSAAAPRVPKENILQLLPDAVVPTREELVAYWRKVAPRALKYLAHRPLKLVRHVRGTTFYHKGPLPPIPATVHQLTVQRRQGGEATRLWIDGLAGLLGLVDIGVVEVHPWNSRVNELEHPDVLVFDLDPGPRVDWKFVLDSAFKLRELLKLERLSPSSKSISTRISRLPGSQGQPPSALPTSRRFSSGRQACPFISTSFNAGWNAREPCWPRVICLRVRWRLLQDSRTRVTWRARCVVCSVSRLVPSRTLQRRCPDNWS